MSATVAAEGCSRAKALPRDKHALRRESVHSARAAAASNDKPTNHARTHARRYLGVELVVAQVERRVDGLERLEVEVHPLLFALVGHDSPAVDHQPVRGHSGIEPATHARIGWRHFVITSNKTN